MSQTSRVGVIGFAHMHANDLLDKFARTPGMEWVACADTMPAVPSRSTLPSTRRYSLKRALEVTGIQVHDDYREMLDRERLDVVVYGLASFASGMRSARRVGQ